MAFKAGIAGIVVCKEHGVLNLTAASFRNGKRERYAKTPVY
jgi:hypothetical protein